MNISKINSLLMLLLLGTVFFMASAGIASAATLQLSPAIGTYQVGEIFNVSIILNTESQAIQGVDIHYLNYDPAILEVQDANSSEAGVQISPGGILVRDQSNLVDTSLGRINYSQLSVESGAFSGSGIFATVTFKALANGSTNVTFDYTAGVTTDCNVGQSGQDLLSGVTNGRYTIGSEPPADPPPVIIIPGGGGGDTSSPSNVANLQGSATETTITLTWENPTQSDFEGVRIRRKTDSFPTGVNDGTEVYQNSGTSFTDSNLLPNATYYYKVFSFDEVPNYSLGVGIKIEIGSGEIILGDGNLIKGSGSKVYVLEDGKKRWITSARALVRRGYRWENIITLSDLKLASYPDGKNIPFLIRVEGDHKVYFIDKGLKRHIPSIEVFDSYGFLWEEVEIVTVEEGNDYRVANHVKLANDNKVYYVTNSGMKRHIVTGQVFNSYGNNWAEISVINQTELNAYPENTLVKAHDDYKVYKLENGVKRWVVSAEAFDYYHFNWSQIAPVNQTEINAYPTGGDINLP